MAQIEQIGGGAHEMAMELPVRITHRPSVKVKSKIENVSKVGTKEPVKLVYTEPEFNIPEAVMLDRRLYGRRPSSRRRHLESNFKNLKRNSIVLAKFQQLRKQRGSTEEPVR